MEDIGYEYFYDLVLRLFFELSLEGLVYFKMYSLISDLVKWVVGDVYLLMENFLVLKNR